MYDQVSRHGKNTASTAYAPCLDLPLPEMHLVKVPLRSDPLVLLKVVVFLGDGHRGFFLQGPRCPRILRGCCFLWRRRHGLVPAFPLRSSGPPRSFGRRPIGHARLGRRSSQAVIRDPFVHALICVEVVDVDLIAASVENISVF
jgi:hypothetical protein